MRVVPRDRPVSPGMTERRAFLFWRDGKCRCSTCRWRQPWLGHLSCDTEWVVAHLA